MNIGCPIELDRSEPIQPLSASSPRSFIMDTSGSRLVPSKTLADALLDDSQLGGNAGGGIADVESPEEKRRRLGLASSSAGDNQQPHTFVDPFVAYQQKMLDLQVNQDKRMLEQQNSMMLAMQKSMMDMMQSFTSGLTQATHASLASAAASAPTSVVPPQTAATSSTHGVGMSIVPAVTPPVEKLDDVLLAKLKPVKSKFEKSLRTLESLKSRRKKEAEDIALLSDTSEGMFRYPPNTKPWKDPTAGTELQSVLDNALLSPLQITLTIPAGTSRVKGMEMLYHHWVLQTKQIWSEYLTSRESSITAESSKQAFINAAQLVRDEFVASRAATLNGVGGEGATPVTVHQPTFEEHVLGMHTSAIDRIRKEVLKSVEDKRKEDEKERLKDLEVQKLKPAPLLAAIVDSMVDQKLNASGLTSDIEDGAAPVPVASPASPMEPVEEFDLATSCENLASILNSGNGVRPGTAQGNKKKSSKKKKTKEVVSEDPKSKKKKKKKKKGVVVQEVPPKGKGKGNDNRGGKSKGKGKGGERPAKSKGKGKQETPPWKYWSGRPDKSGKAKGGKGGKW